MKITKLMRALLVSLSLLMVLPLFACTPSETTETSDTQKVESTEESLDETTEANTSKETADTDGDDDTQGAENTESTDDKGDDETESANDTSDTEKTQGTDAPECKHTDVTSVAAVAATCSQKGNAAYKVCECGVIWNANGEIITAIPELPVDETAHGEKKETYVDGEAGRTYKYACVICGKADYEYTVKIGKNKPNVIVNASALLQKNGAVNMGEALLSDDGSYVRFNSSTATGEGYFVPYKGDGTVTGQYMAIRYRTNTKQYWEMFVGANNGQESAAAGDNFKLSYNYPEWSEAGITADGQWRTTILDLSKLRPERFLPESDGTYVADYIRWDIFNDKNGQGADIYVDVAYVALADNLDALVAMTDITGYVYVEATHQSPNNYTSGQPLTKDTDNVFIDPTWLQGQKTDAIINYDEEHNGMQYATLTQSATTSSAYAFRSKEGCPVPNSGNYVGIIYRKSADSNPDDYFQLYINSTQNGAIGGSNCGKDVVLTADGEWHIWLAEINTTEYDPVTGLWSIRFDYFNKAESAGETVDIAFIATYDSEAQAMDHFAAWSAAYNLGIAACGHKNATEYEEKAATCTEKGNDSYKVCNDCKAIVGADGTVLTAVPERAIDAYAHDKGEIDKDDNCNRKCTRCGQVTAVAQHTAGQPDADNECAVECTVCHAELGNKHSKSEGLCSNECPTCHKTLDEILHGATVINMHCEQVCEKCGVKVSETVIHQGLIKHEETASTCSEKGHYAYNECKRCNAIINSRGETLQAIPEKELDPDAHGEIAETFTDSISSRTYKKACIDCGGAKVYEYTIATGETKPNVIVTAGTLAQLKGAKANMGEAILADDGSYVRFNSSTTAGEGYFMPYVGDGTVTGQYMIIRYRTNTKQNWELFVGANNGQSGFAAGDNFRLAYNYPEWSEGGMTADGQWRTTILDLAKLRPERFLPETDGTYVADYIRWDIFNEKNGKGAEIYVDVAYVAFADNLEALVDMTDITGYIYVEATHGDSNKTSGQPLTKDTDNVFIDPMWLQGQKTDAKINYDEEHNGMQYATLTQSATTSSAYAFRSKEGCPVPNSGNYIGIIYRKNADGNAEDYFQLYINSTQNGAIGGSNCGKTVALTADGEWHIWLAEINTTAYNPETGLWSIRFDFFNKAESAGETVDIAFLATYDDEDQAYAHFAAWNAKYALGIDLCRHTNVTEYTAKASTCTEKGNDAYKVCNDCNAIMAADGTIISAIPETQINANAHDEGTIDTNDNCNKKCTRCGTVLAEAQHTEGQPDADNECTVKCTVCNADLGNKHTSSEGTCTNECSVCHKILGETVHGNTIVNEDCEQVCEKCGEKVSLELSHGVMTEYEETNSTCTVKGHYAYKVCQRCDAIFNSAGETVQAIPEKELDATAHGEMVETYTDSDTGRTYKKVCADCGEGKVYEYTINTGVTKPNVIVTAGTLAQLKGDKANMGDAILADDGSYVRFNSSTTAGEGYFMPYVGDGTVTGQYMIIRYRTNTKQYWEMFVGANNGQSGFAAGDNFRLAYNYPEWSEGGMTADGQWRTTILDLAKLRPERFLPETDGTYVADYIRWDIFNEKNGKGAEIYVDVAYVAFADNLEALVDMTDITGYIYVEATHQEANYTSGQPLTKDTDNVFIDPMWLQGQKTDAKINYDKEHNGMQYATLTQSATPSSAYAFRSKEGCPVPNSGNYIGIIYRKNAGGNAEDYFQLYINSTKNGAIGGSNCGKDIALTADGEWHIWLAEINTSAYNPETGLWSIRFDFFNKAESAGETVDIAFLATYDSTEQAQAHFEAWDEYYGLDMFEE